MAVAYKTALGSAFINAAGTALSMTTTAAIAIGDFIVVRWASDNLSATTPTATILDGAGNTYTMQRQGAVNATAAAGVAGGIFTSKAAANSAAGLQISLTFSGSITGKAMYAESFTGVENTVRVTSASATGTVTGASSSALGAGTVPVGDLLLGTIANETRATITGATTSGVGNWSTKVQVNGGGTSGQDATSVAIAGQYVITTGSASGALYTPTAVASEWWCSIVAMQASPDPAISQAAYQFFDDAGTETGAAALGALNTAITGNISSGDGLGVLRVRLQNTIAVATQASDDWQLQWERNANGTWYPVVPPSAETLTHTYDIANRSTNQAINVGATGYSELEWCINRDPPTIWEGRTVTKVSVALAKIGTPTGTFNMTIRHGVNFALLQTSSTVVDVATLTTTPTWVDFLFPTPYPQISTSGFYFDIVAPSGATSPTNALLIGVDNTSPTDPGFGYIHNNATSADDVLGSDPIYRVYMALTSRPVLPYDNPNLTNGAATTNRLGAGTGTFVAGKITETGEVPNMGWSASNYTELVYSLKLPAAELAAGDTLRFRVLRNGATTFMTYSQTPTINIIVGPGPVALAGSSAGVAATTADLRVTKPLATLVDTFDTQIDPAVWTINNRGVWESGRAKLPSDAGGAANMSTAYKYSLTGSGVFVRVYPAAPGGTRDTNFFVRMDSNNWVAMYVRGTDLRAVAVRTFNGGGVYIGSPVTYDPVAHAWMRIRESGGTIYFDTSPDGATWTNYTTTTVTWDIGQMQVMFATYNGDQTPSDAYFDNINIVPPPVVDLAGSAGGVSTLVGTLDTVAMQMYWGARL